MGTKILIAIPCMDMIHTDFVRGLFDLGKPDGTVVALIQGTLIYEARNVIAQNAIRDGFDMVLWMDSDMIAPPDTLYRMIDHYRAGIKFVSAMYYRRRPPANPVICKAVRWECRDDGIVETCAESYVDYPRGVLFPIEGAGFGCCMTSASLLRDMVEKYGAPFTPLMGMGEDLAFCWRARKLGHKLFCDSKIICGHIGLHTYGDEDYLAERRREDASRT